MISLRQHVASLVAVFLALAVGIALGGGLLADTDDDPGRPAGLGVAAETPDPPSDERRRPYADAFAAAGAARLYANGLDRHATAILAMPGADPAEVKALSAQIIAAGGAMTGTFTAGETLVEPGQKNLVETLGSQLMTQLADPRIDPAAATYDRMGQLLALAMATDQVSSVRADPAAVTIRQAPGRRRAAHLTGRRPQRPAGPRRAAARDRGRPPTAAATQTHALRAGQRPGHQRRGRRGGR